MTVAEMLGRISSAELTEWMVYYKIIASEISSTKTQPKAQSAEQQKFLLSGLMGFEK